MNLDLSFSLTERPQIIQTFDVLFSSARIIGIYSPTHNNKIHACESMCHYCIKTETMYFCNLNIFPAQYEVLIDFVTNLIKHV